MKIKKRMLQVVKVKLGHQTMDPMDPIVGGVFGHATTKDGEYKGVPGTWYTNPNGAWLAFQDLDGTWYIDKPMWEKRGFKPVQAPHTKGGRNAKTGR